VAGFSGGGASSPIGPLVTVFCTTVVVVVVVVVYWVVTVPFGFDDDLEGRARRREVSKRAREDPPLRMMDRKWYGVWWHGVVASVVEEQVSDSPFEVVVTMVDD
jgi:hypothetical protein